MTGEAHKRAVARARIDAHRAPAWLAGIPGEALYASDLGAWLTRNGWPRASLLDVEAERHRRRHKHR